MAVSRKSMQLFGAAVRVSDMNRCDLLVLRQYQSARRPPAASLWPAQLI